MNTKNKICAMEAAPAEIPPKPKIPAMIATMKKINDQKSIKLLSAASRSTLWNLNRKANANSARKFADFGTIFDCDSCLSFKDQVFKEV